MRFCSKSLEHPFHRHEKGGLQGAALNPNSASVWRERSGEGRWALYFKRELAIPGLRGHWI